MSFNSRSRLRARLTRTLLAAPLLAAPGLAMADCVADSTGSNVTCSGTTSAAYTNLNSGINVTVASGTTLTAPLLIGTNGTLANAGTITSASAIATVQYGNNATVNNTGTLTTTGTGTTAFALVVGSNSTVTNAGTMSAPSGTTVAQLGAGSTFTNSASAPVALVGNVVMQWDNTGTTATFTNNNLTYGFIGNLQTQGTSTVVNSGLWTGSYSQTYGAGTATFTNNAGAVFTGNLSISDRGIVLNNGTMTVLGSSGVGLTSASATPSSFTNSGTLTVGTGSAAGRLVVNGAFVQTAGSTLNLAILPAGTASIAPGTNFSQVYASGAGGTASLAGTVALSITPGFYPTGSVYQLVLADKGVTGSVTLTGNSLPFLTFVPLGIVTTSGTQQAYAVQVQRTTTYAGALAAGTLAGTITATPNQLAIAGALQPLATSANSAPGGNAAALVGAIDVLSLAQAQTFLEGVSPAGYLSYATALRDQANTLTRQVALRIADHNSDRTQDGFWGSLVGQFQFGATPALQTKSRLFGFNIGYDISSPKFVVGGVFHASWDSQNLGAGTMSGTNSAFALEGYGAYKMGPLRAALQAGYVFGHLGATKTFSLGSTAVTAKGAAGEHLLKATGTVGFELKADSLSLEPFVGVDYVNGKINGFTETGPNAAALTVAPIGATRTDLIAGYSLTSNKGLWRPYVRTQYRAQTGNGPSNTVSAYFNGDSTTSFTVTGYGQSRHEINTDMGLNYVLEDQGGFFLGYQGTSRGGRNSHGFTIGARIEFE